MEVHLQGKRIFITGGTSALGDTFVRRAVEEGASVYFTYFQDEANARGLKALGAKGFRVDLADRREIDRLKAELKSDIKELDALVHNAAIVQDHTVEKLSEEEWDRVLRVDLDAVYYLTKQFLSFLFKRSGSKILNVISRVGLRGGFGEANYAAAKGGLIAFTKSLALELGKKKILVNGLNPGFMKSKMTALIPEQAFQRNIDESVLGECSDPERVSNFMIYLLSDQFSGVSGQIFHMDSRKV